MSFVYRVTHSSSKSPVKIILSKTNILRELHKTNISGCPPKFYHGVMYIAPSSGHILLNINLPFKLILRRCEVVF